MDWRIKGVVQKLLSLAPGGTALNHQLQLRCGDLRRLDRNLTTKLEDWAILAGHHQAAGQPLAGLRLVEIGAGWYPLVPLCYALAGAATCHTYDITRHLNPRLTRYVLRFLGQHLPRLAEVAGVPLADVEQRHRHLSAQPDVPALLAAAHIVYHAPADARETGLPAASVDAVFSNSVLEHVPGEVIAALLREAQRVLVPDGLTIHSVNCGDHYAYFDRTITPMNYYRYTAAQWRRWDNDLLYQNRLRPQDFRALVAEAGFTIERYLYRPRPELLARLPELALAPEFQHYPPEQLCSTSVDVVGRRSR